MNGRTISDAVNEQGWRYILGTLRTAVFVPSLDEAVKVAAECSRAAGDLGRHVLLDVRAHTVILTVLSPDTASLTAEDIDLARRLSEAVTTSGRLMTAAGATLRSVQTLEIAIDAMDIPLIRPFWKAVLGYVDEADTSVVTDPLVDPLGQGPAIWFQQMDLPRTQRNRIHVDVSVPHDEATPRIEAALSAGGVLRSDARAPAFWVLADPEGNEACITTWQGRDS